MALYKLQQHQHRKIRINETENEICLDAQIDRCSAYDIEKKPHIYRSSLAAACARLNRFSPTELWFVYKTKQPD